MNSSALDHLRVLVAGVPALSASLNWCIQKWGTETPPDTIAFAEVGDAIAQNLSVLPKDVRRRLFAAIEEGVLSQDLAVRSAMTTGLLEALVASADKNPRLWEELEIFLGAASRKHAEAWRNFGR